MEEARLYSCAPGREDVLVAELAATFPTCRPRRAADGWVGAEHGGEDATTARAVAFARQCLPRAQPLDCESVSAWAKTIVETLIHQLAQHAGPWRLHVFCHDIRGAPLRARRCTLVREAVLAQLKQKQRRLLRSLVANDAPLISHDEVLAQVALLSPTHGFISVADHAARVPVRRVLSRFAGGEVEVPDDDAPPSRAYKKLLEAEAHLGHAILAGDTCVDLGGAPGGWSAIALSRGARVTAVDRAPLAAELMSHAHLRFVRGDGFAFEPAAQVTWLLCDIIAFPAKSLELLERWLARSWCRHFVVTLKFRGTEDYGVLQEAKKVLDAAGANYLLRQLAHNKNEVTAIGTSA